MNLFLNGMMTELGIGTVVIGTVVMTYLVDWMAKEGVPRWEIKMYCAAMIVLMIYILWKVL